MLDHRPVEPGTVSVSHRKNAYGKRGGRGLAVAGFFAPFVVAAIAWLALPGEGLAQVSGSDPLNVLQQLQRNGTGGISGLGGLNSGVVDTTTQLPQNQTLLPQTSALAMRQPPSRLEQI